MVVYLSQLINKNVFQNDKVFGKIIDVAVFENRPNPPISKFEIQHGKEKLTISPHAIQIENGHLALTAHHSPFLPYDHKDFYLVEDLLDKQVIDTDGRRLVRVNDVLMESNTELKVIGIDIGFAGILRRLGLGKFFTSTTVLPWHTIEAFDYQTGTIRIKLKQSSLNTLHPADLADILEDVGTKERLGIVAALDPKQAAKAIEEADEETQVAILENLGTDKIKDIVNKMRISELADVFNDLNPLKAKEVQSALGDEKSQKIKKLLSFPDDVAGGLMHPTFFQADCARTIKETLHDFERLGSVPETVIVTNGNGKIVGTILSKNLLILDKLATLKDIVIDKKFVFPHTSISQIIELFAQYNLRVLPVVDTEKKPIGIILIDDILSFVEQESQQDENI